VERVVATVPDPEGRPVELTEARWQHILDGHPELAAHQGEVLTAVSAPRHRRAGRSADEAWFYLATTRPSRWLKVVIRYSMGKGSVVTAFPRRSVP
jgi:hypothetical protein